MIHTDLHKKPVALDRERHRTLKIDRGALGDWSRLAAMNAFFVNAVEFLDVAREYPIVFVRAGTDAQSGKPEIAPVAVFGLTKDENLFVEGGLWRAEYIPAHLRAWPFAMAPTQDGEQLALCIDESCAALNEERGTPLFEADGQPSAYMVEVQKYLETLEAETLRTRAFCARVLELQLLREMRFDAKVGEGDTFTVEGFLALDDKKFGALPDATVLELHRNGGLMLIQAHHMSLGNMRRLFERRMARRT